MSLPLAPFGPRTGLRGMVAAADQLATSAGLGLLERGGSAADAAVATGAAMAVVGPHLCGLGGDMLAMVSPPGGAPEALLSIGRAGAGSDADRLRRDGHRTMPVRGDIRSVQVPGAVDGWLALHERYGRLPLPEVLAPAIELATDGFPASIMLALASHLVHAVAGAGELCPGGPLEIGQTVRLPGISRRCAPSRVTGAKASIRASSGAACRTSGTATSLRRTSPPARRRGARRSARRHGATSSGPCRPRHRVT